MRPVGIVLFVGLNVIYIVNEMISLIQHKQVLPFWGIKVSPTFFVSRCCNKNRDFVFKLLLFRENVYDRVFAIALILKSHKAENCSLFVIITAYIYMIFFVLRN